MTSIEQRKNIAKIVLFLSTTLLVLIMLSQLYPDIFSPGGNTDVTSEAVDLGTAHKDILDRYDDYNKKISEFNGNSNSVNDEINEIKSYSDKTNPKYAIGAGISIIVGIWISTIIFYRKASRDLFTE